MMCESSSFTSIGKWYLRLAHSSLAYLIFPELFMFWRSDEDCLLRTLNNYEQKNPFSSTIDEGLHKFSTSEFKQDTVLKWLECMNPWSLMSVKVLPGNEILRGFYGTA